MYSLATLIQFLAVVTILSAAILASLYLILPRVARRAHRPRYFRKG